MIPIGYDIDGKPMRKNEVSATEKALEMKELYHEAEDRILYRMSKPLDREVSIFVVVESEHASNLVTRRSYTGVMIYVNMAPIVWYIKKQNTVKSSNFGVELIALKITVRIIESLQYKLRIMGIPLTGPS